MKLKKKCQSAVISFLERRYPGIRDIVNLLDTVRERVAKQYVPGVSEVDRKRGLLRQTSATFDQNDQTDSESQPGVFKSDDGKWRPVVVTLGLMYKLQKVTDDHWYDVESVFLKDEDKKTQIVDLLAKYWWYIMAVGKSIRGKEEELYENIAKGLKKSQEDVLYAFTKDAEKAVVEDHSPDIAVVVDDSTKEIVLTVCGTKMFPVPSVADVLMDLYADNVPFHQGVAHKGMALACTNILEKVLDKLVEKLTELRDYKLVILGYSLGAGVAQLLAIELSEGESRARLPAESQVLCVTYGAPPVYRHSSPGYSLPNIISVYNHNDGLASLSLHTVTKLFLQIRAVNRLGLSRRRTLRLLRSRLGMLDNTGKVRRHVRSAQERDSEWEDILTACTAVDKTGFLPLNHIAGVTYLVKRSGEGHMVRVLQGSQANPLAGEVRLRGGMFNDHMPWGYTSVFKEYI